MSSEIVSDVETGYLATNDGVRPYHIDNLSGKIYIPYEGGIMEMDGDCDSEYLPDSIPEEGVIFEHNNSVK